MPPIEYADNDGVYIAYRTFGDGDDVIMTASATLTMETMWTWVQVIAESCRVTWYDKRGTGASDGAANFSFEERVDDIRAVMDAAGIERAHLYGASEGGPQSIIFAATYPDRVKSLTLYGTYPAWMKRRDYPHGWDMTMSEYSRFVDRIVASIAGDREAMLWFWDMWAPTLAATPGFLDVIAGLPRSTSPGAVRLIWEAMYEADVRALLPSIQIPTTVVHVTGDRVAPIEGARYLAARIPDAKLVEIDGNDHFVLEAYPEILDAIQEQVANAGDRKERKFERRLMTVLFTDIVDSTPTAARAGDRAWIDLLDRHDALAQDLVASHLGRLVKTTGDGLVATFEGPSRAVSCAAAMQDEMVRLGLSIRAGVHVGEIEVRSNDDIGGMGVHIASRIAGLAGPSQTIVSRTVKDLVVGSSLRFDDFGEHLLKGVGEPWQCYSLSR